MSLVIASTTARSGNTVIQLEHRGHMCWVASHRLKRGATLVAAGLTPEEACSNVLTLVAAMGDVAALPEPIQHQQQRSLR